MQVARLEKELERAKKEVQASAVSQDAAGAHTSTPVDVKERKAARE